jgi:putative tricarboxylic transport membrane protein
MIVGAASLKTGAVARTVETGFTLLLVPFSLFFIWQGMEVPEPPRTIVVGPRTFPMVVGCLLLVVSALLVWRRVRKAPAMSAADDQNAAAVPVEDDDIAITDWPAVWTVLGSLLALLILLEPLGFVIAFSLFIFGLSTLFSPTRWLMNLVVSLAFSVFFYFLFTRVLEIPLPNGVLAWLL